MAVFKMKSGKTDNTSFTSLGNLAGNSHGYVQVTNLTGSALKWDINQSAFEIYSVVVDTDHFNHEYLGNQVIDLPVGNTLLRIHNTGSGTHSVGVGAGSVVTSHKTSATDGRDVILDYSAETGFIATSVTIEEGVSTTTRNFGSISSGANEYVYIENLTGTTLHWDVANGNFEWNQFENDTDTTTTKFVSTGDIPLVIPAGSSFWHLHNTSSASHSLQLTAGGVKTAHGTSVADGTHRLFIIHTSTL